MKKGLLFMSISMLTFFSCATLSIAEEIVVDSRINDVTVYPGAAHITRSAEINLVSGQHSLILKDIIPVIDEDSLNVSGKGQAVVKIFGGSMKREYQKEPSNERIKALQDQIQDVEDLIHMDDQELVVLGKKTKYLDSLISFSQQQLPKDIITSMPTPESLGATLLFLETNLRGIEEETDMIRFEKRELNEERNVLYQQLNELRAPQQKMVRSIVVDVQCETPGPFTLTVSYLVNGANWHPVYDARAQLDRGKVELTAFGIIQQNTGEDWENVNLTLSTARPTIGGRMPYVEPWILRPYRPEPRRGNRMLQKAARSPESQIALYAMDATIGAVVPAEREEVDAEMVFSQVAQKGVSVVYQIAKPATVKSDGTDNKYPITAQMLAANFEYSSYPRLNPKAFLGSLVTNAKDLQLLAGQVNLFLEGDYVGKSSIDQVRPGEKFNFYLGVDDNIEVKREQIEKNVDDILIAGIKAPNIKTTFKYKLSVQNFKDRPVKIHLFEAMPVPENDRIKVKIFGVSQKPRETNFKDRKGVWRWEFQLKPQEKKVIGYSFSIDHPKDMVIGDL